MTLEEERKKEAIADAYREGIKPENRYKMFSDYTDSEESTAFRRGQYHGIVAESIGTIVSIIMIWVVQALAYILWYSSFIVCGLIPVLIFSLIIVFTVGRISPNIGWPVVIALFSVSLYLTICGFEYLRGRIITAKKSNRQWRPYYLGILFFREVFGIIVVYLLLFTLEATSEQIISSIFLGAVLATIIFVKNYGYEINLLEEKTEFSFATWAYNRGSSVLMENIPIPKYSEPYPKQIPLLFSLSWYLLSLIVAVVYGAKVFIFLSFFIHYSQGLSLIAIPALFIFFQGYIFRFLNKLGDDLYGFKLEYANLPKQGLIFSLILVCLLFVLNLIFPHFVIDALWHIA